MYGGTTMTESIMFLCNKGTAAPQVLRLCVQYNCSYFNQTDECEAAINLYEHFDIECWKIDNFFSY